MDSSIGGANHRTGRDIPVVLDTLKIDEVTPEKGDRVNLRVTGTISKIVNGTAYVTPETVNGAPYDETTGEEDEMTDDELLTAARDYDMETSTRRGAA